MKQWYLCSNQFSPTRQIFSKLKHAMKRLVNYIHLFNVLATKGEVLLNAKEIIVSALSLC
jgi:hypothetical protein